MYTYPYFNFLKEHAGSLINIFSFGGYPVSAISHIGFFSPVYRLLVPFFDFISAYHLIIYADYLLAAFLTYSFIRSLGASKYASFLGMLAYIFSQWSVLWFSSINLSHIIYLLPALFLSILKLSENRWRYSLLLLSVVGLSLSYSHYQFLLLVLVFSGLFFLYIFYKKIRAGSNTSNPYIFLALFVASLVVGFVIGAPQLMSTLSFIQSSARASATISQSVWYFDLLRYLIPSFELPFFSTQEFLPYIGIIPLFLAIYALSNFKKIDWGGYGKFFVWSYVFCIIVCLKYSPLFFIVKNIPYLGHYFLQPSRFLLLGNFSLAIIAAFGFDFIINNKDSISTKIHTYIQKIIYYLLIFIAIFNLGYLLFKPKLILILNEYFLNHLYKNTIQQSISYYYSLIDSLVEKVYYNFSVLNPNIWIFIISLVSVYYLLKLSKDRLLFKNCIVLFTVINLLSFYFINLYVVDRKVIDDKPLLVEKIKSLESDVYSYKVFGFMTAFAQYKELSSQHPKDKINGFIFSKETFMANSHMYYDVPIVGGYEPLAPGRYQSLINYLNTVPKDISEDGKNKDFDSKVNLLSMLNSKYIVSPYKLNNSKLDFLEKIKITSYDLPIYLYKNNNALPEVYMIDRPTFLKENDSENLKIITSFVGDFSKESFIECNDCTQTTDGVKSKYELKKISENDHKIEISIDSGKDGWLILSRTFVPGWKAYIDGVDTKIYLSNYINQAVQVPKGLHRIVFEYSI